MKPIEIIVQIYNSIQGEHILLKNVYSCNYGNYYEDS